MKTRDKKAESVAVRVSKEHDQGFRMRNRRAARASSILSPDGSGLDGSNFLSDESALLGEIHASEVD